jgi:SAM-dependent methyltransferase
MQELDFSPENCPLPKHVGRFLRAVDRRMDDAFHHLQGDHQGFIPADYVLVYQALHTLQERSLACGDRFLEWGCGIGAVAGMASMLGFESYGIEIDSFLVEQAEELLEQFGLETEIVNGSFIPEGSERLIDVAYRESQETLNLDTSIDDAYRCLGIDLEDVDVVFVFPWPNDEPLCRELFRRHAGRGALLLTYDQTQGIRLFRK